MSSAERPHATAQAESAVLSGDAVRGIPYHILAVAGLVIVVTVLRLPSILWPHELNPDESQMLSQAMKYLVDPVPWRGVDGTSGGPFNSYLISLFLVWGIKPGYILVHIIADILVCLQIAVAYRTLLKITSRAGALWGTLPIVCCFGLTSSPDFLHYSSELLPGLLLALGFELFVAMAQARHEGSPRARWTKLFFLGVVLGLSPWCKLQALPLTGVLLAAVTAHILLDRDREAFFRSDLVWFWLGILLPGAAILTIVAGGGALNDFWHSYILGNIAYAGMFRWLKFFRILGWALWLPEIRLLTLALSLALASLLLPGVRRANTAYRPGERWLWVSVVCWFFTALFVIGRPGFRFPHYAIFLLLPMTYLTVLLVSRNWPLLWAGKEARARQTMTVLAGCAVVVLSAYAGVRIEEVRVPPHAEPDASERIAAEIKEMQQTSPVHSLAIWGWEPGVYVLTGIPPATRDSIGHFVITLGFSQPYFQQRFAEDMRRANPDVFIDAVAQGAFMWIWNENDGYESDPELKSFVNEHYVLANSLVLQTDAKPVRFFRRR